MKKYLVLMLTLMLTFAWAWSAEEDVKTVADNVDKPLVETDGVAVSPVKEGNLLDSTNPIPDPPVITTNIISEDFETAWTCDGPPAGWTIIDNGSDGSQAWWWDDWYKYYFSTFGDTTARIYYSYSLEDDYDEWLISPSLVISGTATACSLSWQNYYNDDGAGKDTAYVKITTDGGSNWTDLVVWDEDHYTSPYYEYLDLTSYIGQTVQIAFNLTCNTGIPGDIYYWYVDEFSVWTDEGSVIFDEFDNWGPYGDNPPTGWTIIDNGTPSAGSGVPCDANDWEQATYPSGWSSNTAMAYYTSSAREVQDEWLISPSFAISSGVGCTLSVAEYFYVSTTYADQYGYIKVSTDGGSTWPYTIAEHSESTIGSSSSKEYFNYSLDDFVGESNVAIAFNFKNIPYGYDRWVIDDVSVDEYVPPSEDAGVTSIDEPRVMDYTNVNHTIVATIENLLADSTIIDSIEFKVEDSTPAVVFGDTTYPGTYILGYASQQFSSGTAWSPTTEDWYTVTVTFWGSGDGFAGNNSLSSTKILKDVRSYPYVEDMEVATAGDLPMVNFILDGTSGGVYWTSSYSHSPTHCVYFSYSPYPREVAMVFPPVDLSSSTYPMMEFFEATYLTYWGDALDQTHTVAIISGDFDLNNVDTLWSYDPNTHTPWDRTDYDNAPPISFDMSPYVGDTVWIVMDYHEPTVDGSYWYLDDVGLREWPQDDIAATSIDVPSGVIFSGSTVSPMGTFTNLGIMDQTIDAALVIEDTSTTIASVIYADTVTGVVVESLGTYQVTFADWVVPAGEAETYALTMEAINPGDENTADNVIASSVDAFTHYTEGGPDAFGYWWIDNVAPVEEDPPVYNWVDITTVGNLITTWQTGSVDDGRSWLPLDLPGGFWYYGNFYDSVCISTNAWIAMVDQTSNYLSNYEPPSTSGPYAGIFPGWDDHDGGTVGSCYYYPDTTNNRFIVSWIDWPYYPDPTNPHDFQVILNLSDSTVVMQFGPSDDGIYQYDITVGMQDSSRTSGLAYYYNSSTTNPASANLPGNHPFDGLAIKYYFAPPAIDAAMTSVDEPTDGAVIFNPTVVTPTVTVTNNGDAATTVDVTFIINDGTTDVYSQTETTASIPGGGGTVQHSFATTWNADTDGEYDVTAYLVLAGDANSANDTLTTSFDVATHYTTGGPDDFGYRWIDNLGAGDEDPPVFAYIDLTASPTADTIGDGTSTYGNFAIGFPFDFYGVSYDSVYVNGYGYLSFGDMYSSSTNDCPVPNSSTPNEPLIGGFWDYGYCNATYDGACIMETFGTSPNMYTVIQFHNWRRSSYNMEWEIILYENGQIIMQYLDIDDAGLYGAGQSAMVGLEDWDGNASGLSYVCNGDPVGNLLVDSLAIKWYIPIFGHDVVADEFIVPATSNGVVNVPITPEVLFTNNGTNDETNVPVRLLIEPGGYNDAQSIAVLDSGTSYSQTFAQFTPTSGGVYTLTAISELVGDEDPASDTLVMTFYVFDDIFDFESGPGPLLASGGSTGNPPDFNGDWEWGVPYGGTYGPSTAYSPVNCWGMNLDGAISTPGYSDTCWSIVDFQLDVGTGNDAVFGYYEWNGLGTSYYDSAFVIANDDTLLVFNGNNEEWHYISLDLSAYTGVVDMRFYEKKTLSGSSYDGWYFDDFTFINCELVTPEIDVTPLAITGEADPGFAVYDTITVSNIGEGDLIFTAAAVMNPSFTDANGEIQQLYAVGDALNIRRVPENIDFDMYDNGINREAEPNEKIDTPMWSYSSPDPLPIIAVDIAYENFDDGLLPTGWSIVDGGSPGLTWQLHSTSSCVRSSPAWSVDWMIVDSDCPGSGFTFDEQLITSYYDCSSYSPVHLAFNHYYNWFSSDSGKVEVRNGSTGTWGQVAFYDADVTASENFDISSLIGAGDSVQVRFSYWGAYDYYWGIDDFLLFRPDTPWLSIDNTGGTVLPANSVDIEVALDAIDVGPGIYTGHVEINSNDPDEAHIEIPVTFIVGGLGTVSGQVTDANTTSPIEGAVVTAMWTSTTTVVDTTDAGGNYSMDITPGTVNVSVEATGYVTDSQDITVTADQTTTHNVALTAPIAVIDESDIIDTVAIGDTAIYGRYLHNTGTAPMSYSVALNFDLAAPLSIRNNSVSEMVDNVAHPFKDADAAPFRYESGNLPVLTAFQDSVFAFDAETPTGDARCLGVEFDGQFFWVTGAGDGTGTNNQIHKFDVNGNYMLSYPQNTSSAWGWRDLAWDGQYLYASDDYDIDVFDPVTGTVVNTYVGTSPVNPCRAIAIDPATGHFWTASFTSDIYEFDPVTGTVYGQFTNDRSAYGMAWDDISDPSTPWLWVFSQDGPGVDTLMQVSQFDPATGTYTGVSFQAAVPPGQLGAIAGGACFTTEFDPSVGALFVVGQGDPIDFVYGYEITPHITWLKVLSGGSGNVPAGDSALIEFQVDFADSTILADSTYEADANINNNDPYSVPVIHFAITAEAGGCDYIVGDVNGSNNYNGLDITYGVNFFKYGSPLPQCTECPPCAGWHYCGDVNNSCNYNGLDITYGVNYFKYGSPAPQPCDDCPPIGPASIGDDELRPAVQDRESRSIEQPSIEMKSNSKKGNELKR